MKSTQGLQSVKKKKKKINSSVPQGSKKLNFWVCCYALSMYTHVHKK